MCLSDSVMTSMPPARQVIQHPPDRLSTLRGIDRATSRRGRGRCGWKR